MSGGHTESKTPVVAIIIIGILLIGALIGIFFPTGIIKKKEAIPSIDQQGKVLGQNVDPTQNRETDAYYTKANIDKPVCGIKVFSPLPGQKITFPLEVSGYVNGCNWVPFEGQVGTLEMRDNVNALSKLIILPVESDNYTLPAYFKIKVTPETMPVTADGVLIFHNENASGDPKTKETFQLPITF